MSIHHITSISKRTRMALGSSEGAVKPETTKCPGCSGKTCQSCFDCKQCQGCSKLAQNCVKGGKA